MLASSLLVLSTVPYSFSKPTHIDSTMEGAVGISADRLVSMLSCHDQCTLVLDCRPFMAYNTGHIIESVNVLCPPILKRRSGGFLALENIVPDPGQRDRLQCGGYRTVVVYDQATHDLASADRDSNLYAVVKSLLQQVDLDTVHYLIGGYESFSEDCPLLCATPKFSVLSVVRPEIQPALPDDHPVEILPHLYLGNVTHSSNRELLQGLGVTALANVSSSCPNHFRSHFRYLHIPVNDNASEDLSRWFPTTNTFIDEVRASGGKVLVHCFAGRSRSATVCIAYLMKTLRLSLEDAFEFVRSRRNIVDPNLNFMQQLQAYSQRLQREQLSAVDMLPVACADAQKTDVIDGASDVPVSFCYPEPRGQSSLRPLSSGGKCRSPSPYSTSRRFSFSSCTKLQHTSHLSAFSFSPSGQNGAVLQDSGRMSVSGDLSSAPLSKLKSVVSGNSDLTVSCPAFFSLSLPSQAVSARRKRGVSSAPSFTSTSHSLLSPREAPAPISLPSASELSRLPPTDSTTATNCCRSLPSPEKAHDICPPSSAVASKATSFFSFSELPLTSAMARTPEIVLPS